MEELAVIRKSFTEIDLWYWEAYSLDHYSISLLLTPFVRSLR